MSLSEKRYLNGTVQTTPRTAVFAVRVAKGMLDAQEMADLAESMREWVHRRGLSASDIVVVQGGGKETLALFGDPHSVRLVREAMFNAAIRWMPLDLG
jgi:hypothetical protein